MERIPGSLTHSSLLKSHSMDVKSLFCVLGTELGLDRHQLAKHFSLVLMELSASRGRVVTDKTARAYG